MLYVHAYCYIGKMFTGECVLGECELGEWVLGEWVLGKSVLEKIFILILWNYVQKFFKKIFNHKT